MTLPKSAHTSRPWRIHEIAHDFRLEDVWALPTPGGPDDFPRLVEAVRLLRPRRGTPRRPRAPVRAALEARGAARARRPGDRPGRPGADAARPAAGRPARRPLPARPPTTLPFTPLYLTEDEWAVEIANRTVHGVLHLGWVPDGDGGYHGQMAVLVKPNGLLGTAYMAAITPFRHLVVYPPHAARHRAAVARRSRGVTLPPGQHALDGLPALRHPFRAPAAARAAPITRSRSAARWPSRSPCRWPSWPSFPAAS